MLRVKYRIPDNYVKDTHLTNWINKNFSSEVVGVFIEDKTSRGTMTKKGTSFHHTEILCCMSSGNTIKLSTSENMFMEKI